MHASTLSRVGGSTAWERMTIDVQAEAYATTAWLLVYSRWDVGTRQVSVEDVALAYGALLAQL